MARADYLFAGIDWSSVETNQRKGMLKDIQAMDPERVLNTAPSDLARYFADKFAIDVPRIAEERITAEQREVQIDVSQDSSRFIHDRSEPFHLAGTEVEIHAPFEGEGEAFRIRPSTFSLNPPRGTVDGNTLKLTIRGLQLEAARVSSEIQQALQQVKNYLDRLRSSAEVLNRSLPQDAANAIEARRRKLLSDRNLVSALGFPIRERPDSPRTFAAPEVRRRIAPSLPPVGSAPFKPEPTLTEADYEYVLSVVQSMAHVMERSPSAFTTMDEEALRYHFLVQLNGHFEGQATGETFNYSGKTDILIRSGGRNIFIAECKYWEGPKLLTATIDQLLGYTSWRDTKTAIIIFNRNKGFSRVLGVIETQVAAHPQFKRSLGKAPETVFRFVFGNRDDPSRELYLTILAFDVPSPCS